MSLPATASPARPARGAVDTRPLRLLAPAAPLARDADERRLERTRELATLERAVDRLAAGEGSVIVLEAAAGPRKTALLEYAARAATDAGCLVRRTTPAPPERDLPYGVVRSLLEAPLRAATGPGWVSRLDGAAEPAAALLIGGVHADAESDIVIAHSVLWLSAGLAAGRGLTLIVDDAHWSDAPSLTVLAYLARRIADVPVLLVIASRPGIISLGSFGAADVLRPAQHALAPTEPAARRAERAWLATERGTAPASDCAAMALDALEDGTLLYTAWHDAAYHRCVLTLIMSDAVDEARRAIAALRDRALARGSEPMRAVAAWYESELALRTGELADAERLATGALELARDEANEFAVGPRRVLIRALAERGAFEAAHELLLGTQPASTQLLHARARLLLADGQFEQAYADACEVGTRLARQGRTNPTWGGWRSTAALALAHLGRRDEAAALSETELALAKAFGAPVPIARAQHARAVAEQDDGARVTMCEQALDRLGDHPAVLESVRLRLELGSALARIGRRVEAREPLRPALADADRAGAALLAQRARRELVGTGLRPRRTALDGTAALTPRQRQIAELAAAGKGNRAIAGELFLSVKTVETHLASAYRMLGVGNRRELAASLAT